MTGIHPPSAAEPLPISVCLVVKNEADRLERSLAPFAGKVSEILAYDSGSTDATVGVLGKFGARIVRGPWLGFSATRRAVWGMAKEDWVLWLDADEVFSQETLDGLRKAFKNYAPGSVKDFPAGFLIRRQVVFGGQMLWHGDWDRDWVLRVFRRDGFVMADRIIHESVTVSGRVERLPGVVAHHSFRDWADLKARSRTYMKLWAKQALMRQEQGGSPTLHAIWCFARGCLIRSGWLDGVLGIRIGIHNAHAVYQKRRLLNYRNQARRRKAK